MALSPEQRVMRAKIASNTRQSRMSDEQRRQSTAAARKAAFDRFERQVDPHGTLDPAERARRAEFARRAHFQRMAFESAKVRARHKAAS